MSSIIFLVCGFASCFGFDAANHFLVEDPSKITAAEDVSVDILFAAFEKFLRVAWTEHMGPLLPANTIQGMQSRFGMLWWPVSEMWLIHPIIQIQGGVMNLPNISTNVWKI